jgi:biotin carboxyl carrier protein
LIFPDARHEATCVQLAPGRTPGEWLAYLGGRSVTVSVNGRRTGRGSADGGAAADGEQTITAPMPGRVVRVLVAPGDQVQARQPVAVVEAMKMENELRARAAGTITEVRVTEGSSVEAGAILVVLE